MCIEKEENKYKKILILTLAISKQQDYQPILLYTLPSLKYKKEIIGLSGLSYYTYKKACPRFRLEQFITKAQ